MFTTPATKPANSSFKDADLKAWEESLRYKEIEMRQPCGWQKHVDF